MKNQNHRSAHGLIWTISVYLFLLATTWSLASHAQQPESSETVGGPIAIKMVGDRILARVELQTEIWFKDAYLVLDYELPFAMAMNYPIIRDLKFGEGETTLKALNDGFRIEIPRTGIIDESNLGDPQLSAELSGRYDKELDQVAVIGILGWPVLKSFGLTLDIQDNSLVLHPEGTLSADETRSASQFFVSGVETIGRSIFLPVNYDGGQRAFMRFNTNSYHTILNREVLDDREAGVVDEVYFGHDESMKLSDMAAFYPQDMYMDMWSKYARDKEFEKQVREAFQERGDVFPEEFAVQRPDQPSSDVLLVAGLSVLSGYRLIMDHSQGFLGLSRTVNSNYSDADHQFYMATSTDDESKLLGYLRDNPDDRNVEEAVSDLVALGVQNGASVERQLETVQFGIDVASERRRFKYIADFVFQLSETPESRNQNSDLIIALGEKALPFADRSNQPRLRQQVQMLVGECYLDRNDAKQGWRHYLNAAFNGDPENEALVRYGLARCYEALGRDSRAYVNYSRAIEEGLPSEQNQNANEALDRLRPRLDPDDPALQATTVEG